MQNPNDGRVSDIMRATVLVAIIFLGIVGVSMVNATSGSVLVTAQMRQNAVNNCEKYTWAQQYRDALIADVQPWMELSDEELWKLPPSQEMPRDSGVERGGGGCPNCGQDHYNASYSPGRWRFDVLQHPWKVWCGNCGERFPKNDFAAYYESALDEHHKFRLGEGDPKFLEPQGDAPAEWTDNGTGTVVDDTKWFFAAHYAFRLWEELLDVTEKMAVLYTLTDDPKYAHKAGVLLDRFADLYPEMDYMPHYRLGMEASTGGSGRGRIQGCIWETWTAQECSLAYDHIHDAVLEDNELVEFSSRMSEKYGTGDKSSPERITDHIEAHLLREFIAGVRDRRIHGNPGMHQYSMACAAIALDEPDETEAALDWLFEPEAGEIPHVLVERLGREGFSDEAALGYSRIPARTFYKTAEFLRRYDGYSKHDILRDYPKFRNCYTMCGEVRMLDRFTPNWGDGNKCMNIGTTGLTLPVEMELQGYRAFGKPEIAREVWFANGKALDNLFAIVPSGRNQPEDIHFHIYADDPEAILEDLRQDIREPGPFESFNTGGHGMAVLQAPSREHPRAFSLYYGRMKGHGHHDRLSYVLVANDVVMATDMGYPLYCNSKWKKRFGWTDHIISHNTCMVNETNPDDKSWSGKTKLFGQTGPVRVIDVDGGDIYEGVNTYRRCMVMVDADEDHSYIVDLFWVRGGENHRLIQNGGGPEVTDSGLELTPQEGGTYAGPDIEYGEEYDGAHNSAYEGTGFSYLERVAKGDPEGPFWVDWQIVEPRRTMPEQWEAHMRIHNLADVDEIALCDGIPPRYKGNPESLRYMLRTRYGQGISSQFVSVIEPYGHEPFIDSVRLVKNVETDEGFAAGVEIVLKDGRRDVVMVTEKAGALNAAGVQLDGRVGWCRFVGQEPLAGALIGGTRLQAGQIDLTQPQGAVTGEIAGWDDTNPDDVQITLEGRLPDAELAGKYIIVDNTERSDASYRIERVIDETTLSIGSTPLVERFIDPDDYSAGVIYNIAAGDTFRIPLATHWEKVR